MKKILLGLGMASFLLAGVCGMTSCSNNDVLYDANNISLKQKNEYKANFETKYGKVDPDQNWDFTGHASKARTRAGEGPLSMTWNQKGYGNGSYEGMRVIDMKKAIEEDIAEVKSLVMSEDVKPVKFPYTYSQVYLYPTFSHGYPSADGNNYDYYYLGADYTVGSTTTTSKFILTSNVTSSAQYGKDYWFSYGGYGGARSCGFDTWREINTISLINADEARWWVGARHYKGSNDYDKTTVEYCKLFTTQSGRQYIAFDCNNNGNYSDLICWIQVFDYTTKEDPKAYGKRYMVEDLGTTDDFDFNDIVFDVIQLADGSQKCYIRALGGTCNVTIKVGNTTWSKKDSEIKLGDKVVMADPAQMYNTQPPHTDWILAEFPVEGWDSTGNEVTVTVFAKDKYGNFYTNTIEFPEKGEVPMMVAVSTNKTWMNERISITSVPESFINDNNYELGE